MRDLAVVVGLLWLAGAVEASPGRQVTASAPSEALAVAASAAAGSLIVDEVRTVRLGRAARIDQVRVEGCGGGEGRVVVRSRGSERLLRVDGAGTHVLQFSPALESAGFDVTVEATDRAAAAPCVARVTLVSGTAPVASVLP